MFKGIATFFRQLFGQKKPAEKVISARNRNVYATGTFEHVTLYDLLVTLIQGGKSGKLRIRIGTEKAVILVVHGKLVNAMYRGIMGEEAVMTIFAEVDKSEDAEFFAEALSENAVPKAPPAINLSMDQLLFKIASKLDHQRQIMVSQ